ncbi:MAG: class I SAM-dependent methyltransferase, partial [Clostridia bacterium]|nr:class I SAM-dependent methyltransferase [Clostridia bacterium]
VTAVDYSALCVEKAKAYNRAMIAAGRCTVLQGNVADLALPAESFDLATAFETVYFWPGLQKCFAEAAKVLKPGGYFLICNESDGTDPTGTKFETIIDGMKSYTAQEIEAALKAAGFSQVTTDHHPAKPWIAVLARKES